MAMQSASAAAEVGSQAYLTLLTTAAVAVVFALVFRSRLKAIASALGIAPKERPIDEEPERENESTAQKNFREDLDDDHCVGLAKEKWVPKLDRKPWAEAHLLPGSPWSFDGCEDLQAALERVWRPPLGPELDKAYNALRARVKDLSVAKVRLPLVKEVHYVLVYTLITGAELFGGAPTELSVGVELGPGMETDEDAFSGLRQRRGGPKEKAVAPGPADDLILPSLAPFYRIHDGFGVLISFKHLAVLCTSPQDYCHGSCFYVYPIRSLEPLTRQPHLVKFARVDKSCVCCVDATKEHVSKVVYVENQGAMEEDDEDPIAFVADTVCNVAGQRVVPPSYMGGPSHLAEGSPF
eukprot:TRINITY_DN111473_c0_g1_i1.p1 TRINITY_DN111473_c0_g1~~TRINITY_DN111473_c0_g1_i1.p1  ORF type:complete len:352 (-),score=74.46 TRINITY_DN111473_c0_g1_i1:48-1103(-)